MRNIVFFNLEVLPYHVAVFKAFIAKGYNCIVYWYETSPNPNYKAPAYKAPEMKGLTLYNRYDFKNEEELYRHSRQFAPLLISTCGWVDTLYNRVCRIYKNRGIKTIAISDTQWHGGKQWINRILSPFRHRQYFDYIWGAGILQYDYARKLGFPSENILLDCFSGDVETFSKVSIEAKRSLYPKRFLFVGRFVHVKAIDVLLKAWSQIKDNKGWSLELIGDGPLKEQFKENYKDVVFRDFMSQDMLAQEAQNSGCFIIPSRFEPWALVIQEFASAGLPIIATNVCGAAKRFVINGHNGYTINANSVTHLREAMENIMNSSSQKLIDFSVNSRRLANQVTPDFVADTLLSII